MSEMLSADTNDNHQTHELQKRPIKFPPGFTIFISLLKRVLQKLNSCLLRTALQINYTQKFNEWHLNSLTEPQVHGSNPHFKWGCDNCGTYANWVTGPNGLLKRGDISVTMCFVCSIDAAPRYLSWVVTPEFVDKHIDRPWDWDKLSTMLVSDSSNGLSRWQRQEDFPTSFLEKHIDEPWNWTCFSNMNRMPLEFIEKHIGKPWCWRILSRNQNITLEFIEKYIDRPLCWKRLSNNPNITPEFVEKHLDKPWDWFKLQKRLQEREQLSIEFVEKHIDEPWCWGLLSNGEVEISLEGALVC